MRVQSTMYYKHRWNVNNHDVTYSRSLKTHKDGRNRQHLLLFTINEMHATFRLIDTERVLRGLRTLILKETFDFEDIALLCHQ